MKSLLILLLTASVLSCGNGSISSSNNKLIDASAANSNRDGANSNRDGASSVTVDAAAAISCATGLKERLKIVPMAGVNGGVLFAAASSTGTIFIAWTRSGDIVVSEIGIDGQSIGAETVFPGSSVYGFAVNDNAWALVYSLGADELFIKSGGTNGTSIFETRLLGNVDHAVTENEWFGSGIRAGRLSWTGTQWAAYYTVQRLWADGVAHYGDQIQLIDPDGSPATKVWSWGCSHSMEVRIAHNGTTLGPACVSDCFPEPGGVHFQHRTFIYEDSAGNCSGGYGDHLGGIVPVDDGFWLAFSSSDNRTAHEGAVVHVSNEREVGAIQWVAKDEDISEFHIGSYHGGLAAAWSAGGQDKLLLLDESGGGDRDSSCAGGNQCFRCKRFL